MVFVRRLLFAVSVTFLLSVSAGGVPVTESAGACETYKQMTGLGDDALECSPGPNFDVCGAYPDDEKVLMKGPEVNDAVMDDNLAHREYCVRDASKYDHCVLGNGTSGTELRPPGYVANVAPYFNNKDYQTGGSSPDWSVCLDKNPDTGGEWYSLDNSSINSYLRDNEGSLGISTSQRSGGIHDIDYYYTENPNPQHPKYNPKGGKKGVSLLADCGPLMDGCGNDGATDRGGVNDNQGTYFAFFENNATIEDYHPQGLHKTSYVNPYFRGYVNRIKALNGPSRYGTQLGDHFDNVNNNTNWFFDTYIGKDHAVQYSYTKYMNWSVASTGVPYPPFGAKKTAYGSKHGSHYRKDYTGAERTHKVNDTVGKKAKAFGNSLSVVAEKDISSPARPNINAGEGFWIDPDDLRYFYDRNFAVDGFEDGDLSEYTVDDSGSGDSASIQTDGVYSGDHALNLTNKDSGDTPSVNSSSGLEDYPQPGDKVSAWVKWDNPGKSVTKFKFGDNGTDSIGVRWHNKFGEFQLRADGNTKDSNSTLDPSDYTGVWTRVVIDWKRNGDVKAMWLDREGNLLSTVEGSYSKDPLGVSFTGQGHGDTEATSYFDRVGIIGLDGPEDWRDYITFDMDLTGADSGIGFDLESGTVDDENPGYVDEIRSTTSKRGNGTAFADIYWRQNSPIADGLEPPVCGDDESEYLIEELGESTNSMKTSGRYACSTRKDYCVSRQGGSNVLYNDGELLNADEASERFGRAKNDREVCDTSRRSDNGLGVWYDQDYSFEYCQNNTLYGNLGVRWFDASFVDRYPYAVVEGLDDDMNPYLYNRNRYQFNSTQGDVPYGAGETPVPTGKNVSSDVAGFYSEYKNNPSSVYNDDLKDYVASKGFCAGDDLDENLIVQESDVSVIDTNFSVIAVADSSGDCVLDGANYPNKISTGDRKVYSTGENVTVNLGPTQRQVTCYNGVWRADGPVFFLRENVEVESGSSSSVGFQLINVQSTQTTFNVTLDVPTDLQPHTEFSQGGVQFTATLPAEETNVYGVDIFGYNESVDSADINVTAEATGTNIQGSDHTTLDIVDQVRNQGVNPANQTANEVPGIGFTQLLVLAAAAYLFYVSRIIAS